MYAQLDEVVAAAKAELTDLTQVAGSSSSSSSSASSSSSSTSSASMTSKGKESKTVEPFAVEAQYILDTSFDVGMLEISSLVVRGSASTVVVDNYNKAVTKFNNKKVIEFVYAE